MEYIKKVLQLQLNVSKCFQEERIMVREKGFSSGRIEGMILQRIEGINRALFTLMVTEPGSDPLACQGEDLENQLLQALLPM